MTLKRGDPPSRACASAAAFSTAPTTRLPPFVRTTLPSRTKRLATSAIALRASLARLTKSRPLLSRCCRMALKSPLEPAGVMVEGRCRVVIR